MLWLWLLGVPVVGFVMLSVKYGVAGAKRILHSRVLFPLMYHAYVSTPIGTLVHNRQVAAARARPVHTACDDSTVADCGSFLVAPVPFMDDNYGYLLFDVETGSTAAVDPADPQTVVTRMHSLFESFRKQQGPMAKLKATPHLAAVLTTHKHMDHAGGNKTLRKLYPEVPVVGGKHEHVPHATMELGDQDTFRVGATTVQALSTPCHTSAHIVYVAQAADGPGALFCGDTLFNGGTGKFFEGSADQMYTSLCGVLAAVPHDSLVFPGHEYTVDCLQFALWAEPGNTHVADKLQWAKGQRRRSLPTIPTTLAEQLNINPFIRLSRGSFAPHVPAPAASLSGRDRDIALMRDLRALKDDGEYKKTAA